MDLPEAMLNDIFQPHFGKRVRDVVETLPQKKGGWLTKSDEALAKMSRARTA